MFPHSLGRVLLLSRVLDEGWSVVTAAQAMGVSCRTGFKWLARFRLEGAPGLYNHSSRTHHCPTACSTEQINQLKWHRQQRLPLWRIAQ